MPIPETLTVADMAPRLRPMPREEMMRRFTIDSNASVADSIKHLAKERITFACVIDEAEGGRVIGAMSERDALKYAVRASSSAFFSGRDASLEGVTKAMSSAERMLSVTPATPVWQALAMIQHKIWRHVAVLDQDERLQSILDIRDLLLELDGGRSDDTRPGTHLRSVWHGQRVADVLRTKRRDKVVEGTTLELYLRTRGAAHTIHATESLSRACKQLARERLTFLVVLEDVDGAHAEDSADAILKRPSPYERNRVVGLVNERDFVQFAAQHDGVVGDKMETTEVRAPLPHCRRASALARARDGRTACVHGCSCPRAPRSARGPAQVSALMTPLDQVTCVSLTDHVSAAVDVLFSKNVRHVPVIDQGHLFGVISLRDVLRPLLPEKAPGSVLGGAEHGLSSSVWRRSHGGDGP